jgi:tRNA(adenine34) deaminase
MTDIIDLDVHFMRRAIELAKYGENLGHRPFGCVIVDDLHQVISETFGTELAGDPTRHSEMLAIKESSHIKRGLLEGCTIYNTHEPCMMCTGAILHSKISHVVFGSTRTDLPQLFRRYDIPWYSRFADTSHPPTVRHGVLRAECCQLFAVEIELLTEQAMI